MTDTNLNMCYNIVGQKYVFYLDFQHFPTIFSQILNFFIRLTEKKAVFRSSCINFAGCN